MKFWQMDSLDPGFIFKIRQAGRGNGDRTKQRFRLVARDQSQSDKSYLNSMTYQPCRRRW
jgi:hypothetical protein